MIEDNTHIFNNRRKTTMMTSRDRRYRPITDRSARIIDNTPKINPYQQEANSNFNAFSSSIQDRSIVTKRITTGANSKITEIRHR